MAIVLLGKTQCVICGKVLQATDKIIGFPAMFPNEVDVLHQFHDAAVHVVCLEGHPLRQAIEKRMAEYQQKTGPGKRRCRVCGREILMPDDYFGLGHLTDDIHDPLFQFNYAHFHRSHLFAWSERPILIRELSRLEKSEKWKCDGLKQIIKELREI